MKKKNVGIVASLIAMCSKVFAKPQILYGMPEPSKPLIFDLVFAIFKIIIVPVLLFVGIPIYLRKSKSSKRKQFIIIMIFIVLLVGSCFLIEFYSNYSRDIVDFVDEKVVVTTK